MYPFYFGDMIDLLTIVLLIIEMSSGTMDKVKYLSKSHRHTAAVTCLTSGGLIYFSALPYTITVSTVVPLTPQIHLSSGTRFPLHIFK